MELKTILLDHFARYPHMTSCDAVKLIYQNEFGCGHFVTDEEGSLLRLKREVRNLRGQFKGDLFENIGNGFTRLNLGALAGQAPLEIVNRIFVESANVKTGSRESFETKLEILKDLVQGGAAPFDLNSLENYLTKYKKEGYPPVSHSDQYRTNYQPSYRVIKSSYAHYFAIFAQITNLLATHPQVVVAIDGPAASGKSTLATLLQSIYDCPVLPIDHFFLRAEQRTAERLQEVGGNVDYERFQEEVLPHLQTGQSFQYQIYNCQTDTLSPSPEIQEHPLRIVEGSYSLHPKFRDHYHLRIFLTIPVQSQLLRLQKRNAKLLPRFIQEWIPLENEYFAGYEVEKTSDLVFNEYKLPIVGNSGKENKGGV